MVVRFVDSDSGEVLDGPRRVPNPLAAEKAAERQGAPNAFRVPAMMMLFVTGLGFGIGVVAKYMAILFAVFKGTAWVGGVGILGVAMISVMLTLAIAAMILVAKYGTRGEMLAMLLLPLLALLVGVLL